MKPEISDMYVMFSIQGKEHQESSEVANRICIDHAKDFHPSGKILEIVQEEEQRYQNERKCGRPLMKNHKKCIKLRRSLNKYIRNKLYKNESVRIQKIIAKVKFSRLIAN